MDRYHVNSSGGSSGRRGVVVYDWDAWADVYLSLLRYVMRLAARGGSRRPLVGAIVAAHAPAHMSAACPQTFSDASSIVMHRFPVTLPFDQIVDGINGTQPDLLMGYPSVLHALALAAQDGVLKISARAVISASEPLLPEIRAAISAARDTKLFNWWATTEGGQVASSCGFGPGMENVMRHATNLKALELPMLLPGVRIHTSADDYFPIEDIQLMRFNGTKWDRFSEALPNQSPCLLNGESSHTP